MDIKELKTEFITLDVPEHFKHKSILLDLIKQDPKLSIYTFTPQYYKTYNFIGKPGGWEPISLASALGKWFELTNSATEIYAHLSEILSETACGAEAPPSP